jgi:hypothetical protein
MALKKELQENFQIANISELVSFDEEETNLSSNGGLVDLVFKVSSKS